MPIKLPTFTTGFNAFRRPLDIGTYTLGRAADCDICLAQPDIASVHLRLVVEAGQLTLIDISGEGFCLNGQMQSFAELPFIVGELHQLQLGRQKLQLRAGKYGWQLQQYRRFATSVWLAACLLLVGGALALGWQWLQPAPQPVWPQGGAPLAGTMSGQTMPAATIDANIPVVAPIPDEAYVQHSADDAPLTETTIEAAMADESAVADKAVALSPLQTDHNAAAAVYVPPTVIDWRRIPDYAGLTPIQPDGRRYFVFKERYAEVHYHPRQRVYTLANPDEGEVLALIQDGLIAPEQLMFRLLQARKRNHSVAFRQATVQALILRIRFNRIRARWPENPYLLQQLSRHWTPANDPKRELDFIRQVLWELYNEAWYADGRGDFGQRDYLLQLAALHDPAAPLYRLTMDAIRQKLYRFDNEEDWLKYMHSKDMQQQIEKIAKGYGSSRLLWLQLQEPSIHLFFLASFWQQPLLENAPYRRLIGGEWADNAVPLAGPLYDQLSHYLAALNGALRIGGQNLELGLMQHPDGPLAELISKAVWQDRVPGAFTLYYPLFKRAYFKEMAPKKFTEFAGRYSQAIWRGAGLYEVLAAPIAAAQAMQAERFRPRFFVGQAVASSDQPFDECKTSTYQHSRTATAADLSNFWDGFGMVQGHFAWDLYLAPGLYRVANDANSRSHYQGRYFLDLYISAMPMSGDKPIKQFADNYGLTAYVFEQDMAAQLPALCVTGDFMLRPIP